MNASHTEPTFEELYTFGWVAAMLIALLLIGEFVVYASIPNPDTVSAHFELFIAAPLAGLLLFDLLGMVAYVLFIPLILALYAALRRDSLAIISTATVLFFVGIAAFFATNTGFPMLALSQEYAMAGTEAEREMLLAAGRAMIAMFDDNAFLVSYFLVSGSWTLMGAAMLRSRVFGRFAALMGLLAGLAGMVAVVLEHLPALGALSIAIAIYFLAIVFLFTWVLLLGRRLYRLSTARRGATA